MSTPSLEVSIVIPCLNEAAYLPDVLRDLAHQTALPKEIIVVDGGSTDGTKKAALRAAKTLQLSWIQTAPGVSGQRTAGAKRATAPTVIFFDADVRLPHPDTLRKLVRSWEKADAACACPLFWPSEPHPVIMAVFLICNFFFWLSQYWTRPAGAGMCLIMSSKRGQEIGWFHPEAVFEDLDILGRAAASGGYAVLPVKVEASSRRFFRDGIWHTTITYARIGWHFLRGSTGKLAGQYTFGGYEGLRPVGSKKRAPSRSPDVRK